MDGYAAYRNGLVRAGNRHGRTLALNWPLWADGGMRVDKATQTGMRQHGFAVLTTTDGIEALYRAWRSGESQVVVVAAERWKLKAPFRLGTSKSRAQGIDTRAAAPAS